MGAGEDQPAVQVTEEDASAAAAVDESELEEELDWLVEGEEEEVKSLGEKVSTARHDTMQRPHLPSPPHPLALAHTLPPNCVRVG